MSFVYLAAILMGKNNHTVTSNGWRFGITNSSGVRSRGRFPTLDKYHILVKLHVVHRRIVDSFSTRTLSPFARVSSNPAASEAGRMHPAESLAQVLLWDPLESTCRHASLSIL